MTAGSAAMSDIQWKQGGIFISGALSSQAAPLLMEAYRQATGEKVITLDFSGMETLEVPGINALIKLHLKARRDRRRLIAKGLSPAFRDVFVATRLGDAILFDAKGAGDSRTPPEWPWARPVKRLSVSQVPEGATNLNVDRLKVAGPVQGFGHLWEKTYRIALTGVSVTPKEVIRALKENFPSFQPVQNRFYPSPNGIRPGEIVIINAATPAGFISTGVWVLYADDLSFTFMTPQGHPESGWVSFKAYEEQGVTIAQVQGFARASDPMFELGFVLMGSKEQERIWKHVLVSLGSHFKVYASATMEKVCAGEDYQWGRVFNTWHNAQARTMIHTVRKALGF